MVFSCDGAKRRSFQCNSTLCDGAKEGALLFILPFLRRSEPKDLSYSFYPFCDGSKQRSFFIKYLLLSPEKQFLLFLSLRFATKRKVPVQYEQDEINKQFECGCKDTFMFTEEKSGWFKDV